MNLDHVSIGRDPPEEVNAIIEVPIGGEPIKYEMDKKAGMLVVDRLPWPSGSSVTGAELGGSVAAGLQLKRQGHSEAAGMRGDELLGISALLVLEAGLKESRPRPEKTG
jgi:hypothetical protein